MLKMERRQLLEKRKERQLQVKNLIIGVIYLILDVLLFISAIQAIISTYIIIHAVFKLISLAL